MLWFLSLVYLNDNIYNTYLVFCNVNKKFLFHKLFQYVLGCKIVQRRPCWRCHCRLNHNNCSLDIVFLHSLTVGFDGFQWHFCIFCLNIQHAYECFWKHNVFLSMKRINSIWKKLHLLQNKTRLNMEKKLFNKEKRNYIRFNKINIFTWLNL